MMDLVGLRDAFFDLEMKGGFFRLEFRGVRYWDYIRASVFHELAERLGHTDAWVEPRATRAERARSLVGELPRLVSEGVHQRIGTGGGVDLVFFDIDIRRLIDGNLVDFRGYPFVKAAVPVARTLVVSAARLTGGARSSYPCEVISSRPAHLAAKARTAGFRLSEMESSSLVEVALAMEAEFGLRPDVERHFLAAFVPQFFQRSWLERLFARREPHLVGFIMDYRKKAVVEMAHAAGAVVFELQHGATSEFDLGESYPARIRQENIPTLPDAILTFGRYWSKKFNVPGTVMLPVGFPYFEAAIRELPSGVFPTEGKVLCPSSFDRGIAEILVGAAECLPEVDFIFKLRPSEYGRCREIYGAGIVELPNVRIVEDDAVSIYPLMRECQYLLSTNSTAIYEGLTLGCTPIICTGIFYQDVLDLVRDGYAYLASSVEEVVSLLRSKVNSPPPDPDLFFQRGSARAIPATVRELLAARTATLPR